MNVETGAEAAQFPEKKYTYKRLPPGARLLWDGGM
jgi:hypothetical protein